MSEMVVRVAAALREFGGRGLKYTSANPFTEADAEDFVREMAEVAIAAMREPTDAMTFAGSESGITETDAHAVWWRMIDEALKP